MEGCDTVKTAPYQINHFAVSSVGHTTVYGFTTGKGYSEEDLNNINTFFNKSEMYDSVQFVALSTDLLLNQKLESAMVKGEIVSRSAITDFARCFLQLDLTYDQENRVFEGNQLVLCDKERQIRGYYDYTQLKEIDRLNTELAILLGKKDE